MSPLESLPNELLGGIFDSALDLQSAVSLSAANRRLNGIWRQDTERIAAEIIRSTIPAYERAIELAVAEQRLEDNSTSANERAPVEYYAQRMLRNHKLAMSAASTFATWLANREADDYRRTITLTCPHASYYVLRKLVLAYRYPRAQFLRHSELVLLRNSSRAMLDTHSELSVFLGVHASEDERAKHDIDMPEEDWPPGTELEQNMELPEWEYAGEVVWSALIDLIHGTRKLEPTLNSVPTPAVLNHNTFLEEKD
jgi:hypothetical protein